jgi:hypothetical protein
MNNTEPLPFYKEPLYYTGLVALIGIGLVIYSIVRNNVSSNLMVPFVVVAFIFGAATYFMWDTRCPHCKRPFSKKEQIEWKEDLGIKKEPYTYHSKVYKYSDGTTENVPGSQKTIMRDRKYDRHYYICKKCEYGSDKEWKEEKGQWLGEAPKPQYIKKKGSSMNLGFDDEKESNRKIRVPIKKSVQRELFNRADNACQLCGTNKRQLHIHHIDKNPSNNSKNNLIVVCAGCHSIAESLTKIQLQNSAQKPYRKSKTINIYK